MIEKNVVKRTAKLIELCKAMPSKSLLGGRVSSEDILEWLRGLDREFLRFQEYSPRLLEASQKMNETAQNQTAPSQEFHNDLIPVLLDLNVLLQGIASSSLVLLLELIEHDLEETRA